MAYTLAYKDRFYRVDESIITSQTEGSLVFASIPDNVPTKLTHEWTGKQFTKLFSALWTGAHLMYPEEANEVIWQLLKMVHLPLTLEGEESGCLQYGISAPFISFYPQNPYNQPDFVPDDYEAPPFFVNSENVYPDTFGYELTDVFVNPAAINIDPLDFLTLNLPQLQIRVRGSGVMSLELLAVTSGSICVVRAGSPPNIIDIIDGIIDTGSVVIDLNIDQISVPPESDITYTEKVEISVSGDDETIVYIVFMPVIDDSLTPLRFGGGIRSLELCGFDGMADMGIESIRLAEDCGLEFRFDGTWQDVEGWENINDCVVPTTLSSASVEAVLPETTTIVEITNNVTNVTNEVNVLQENQTSQNIVPPITDITGDAICDASEYLADKLIETALQAWADSGDLTIAEFLVSMLELKNGFVGDFLTSLYNGASPSYTPMAEAMSDARDYLIQIIYCNELDRAGIASDIAASSDIETHAKDLLVATLNAVTDAKIALWAFVGKETVTGSCSCDPIMTKVFNFKLGSKLGWTENVLSGQTRATWIGDAWDAKALSGYYGCVIELGFTWPTDFVITQTRVWINDTNHAIPFQYVYGLPYVNGQFNFAGPGDGVLLSTASINKGTRTGIGIEFSKTADTGQKITRIEFDYTGTPPAW